MRYFFITILLLASLYAEESQEEKQKVTIGLGPYIQTQPYKNVDAIFIPSPVIFFDNSLFYIRWSRAGVYFLGDRGEDISWGFSLTVQPRTFGYTPSDSSYLEGMNERETTFEGGLAFSASYKGTYIEVMLLTDILDRHNSWILKSEIGDEYKFFALTFYPSLIMIYQSKEFINYYYGVTQEEASRTSFSYYRPGDGIELGLQTYIKYPITDSISILANIRADMIPKSAQNSPIVEDNVIYSGLFSLIYTFEY
jgi:outer membrane protein